MAEKFADIFFLVDSGVSPSDFQQIRVALQRLSNQMTLGASAYRLGLAQYGETVKVEFLLNAHKTREEIQNAVKRFRQRRLPPSERRNLGYALQYASANFFTSEAGSRADLGYRQYLVVISGKTSDDSVDMASRHLKAAGVTVVGISLASSTANVNQIATQPYVYQTISNLAPTLRIVFERQEETVTITGGMFVLSHGSFLTTRVNL